VGARSAVAHGLGSIVGAFKSTATVQYVRGVKANRWSAFRGQLWQRGYYEHVVRNESALARVRRYIEENPARWALDDENPNKAVS
jgi:putative transposase